jgi:hypothetical protein
LIVSTSFVFVDDGDFGPVEKAHQVLVCGVENLLRRMQIDGQLVAGARPRLQVQPGLQVRNVQCVADGLDVRTQDRVRWPENGLNSKVNLLASCK